MSFTEVLKNETEEVEAKEDLPDAVLHAPKSDLLPKVTCPRCEQQVVEEEMESHRNSHSTEILPFLYLGGERNAHNKKELIVRTGVTAILNLAEEVHNCFKECREGCECQGGGSDCNGNSDNHPDKDKPKLFHYYNLRIKDRPGEEVYNLFDESFEILEQVRLSQRKVLVHCVAGISRSATITIAYLMRSLCISLKMAFLHCNLRRPIVAPIPFFVEQLQKYEAALASKTPLDGYDGKPSLLAVDIYPEGTNFINVL
jgi:hypothetical protein